MNKLIKQILIVNLVLLIFGIIFISSAYYAQSYIKNYPVKSTQYDLEGKPMLAELPEVPFSSFFQFLGQIFFWGFPIFVILMSAIYLYKNPSSKDYLRSLLIPITYGFFVILLTGVLLGVSQLGAEGSGFAVMFMLMQIVATFVSVLIINLIILGIKH